MLLSSLIDLFKALTAKQRISLYKIQFLVVFMAISEVIGISTIGPFLALVSDPTLLEKEGFLKSIFIFSGVQNPNDFIFFAGAGVLTVLFASALVSSITIRAVLYYAQRLGAEMSSSLYDYYMRQNWLFHNSINSSKLMNNVVSESNRVTASVLYPFMILNAKAVVGIAIISLLISIDFIVTIFGAFVFGGLYIIIYKFVQFKLNQNGEKISDSMRIRFRLLNEGFDGIKDTLILGRSLIFRERFYESSMKLGKSYGSNLTMNEVPKYWVELLAFGAMISLILFLLANNEGKLTEILPTLGIFAMASYKLLPVFQQVYGNLTFIKGALPALNSIKDDLMSWKKIIEDKKISYVNDDIIFESLNLDNVSFQYPNKDLNAIENVSLEIKKNQIVGFVGKSGSGKSTLADIILGLLDPQMGKIKINGNSLNDSNRRSWLNNFGYVSQNIFLSDSSIRENIAFGIPEDKINEDQISKCIKLANLDELLGTLPDGINTIIGEKGLQLSGGQRQRIAIARSLYNDPSILIFDEATSALDGLNERLIMDSIHSLSGQKTIILIAHRLNTIKKCDLIYLFDQGKLIDSGSFENLKSKNKIFDEMSLNA
jgi:ABC-type multidrug transport system fused ATPase/permease subunit